MNHAIPSGRSRKELRVGLGGIMVGIILFINLAKLLTCKKINLNIVQRVKNLKPTVFNVCFVLYTFNTLI